MTWGQAWGEEDAQGQVAMEGQKSGRGGTMSNTRKIEEVTNDKTGYSMEPNLKWFQRLNGLRQEDGDGTIMSGVARTTGYDCHRGRKANDSDARDERLK